MSAEMFVYFLFVLLNYFFYRDLKIVILGDASVGKTSLIQRYLQGIFTGDNTSVGILILFITEYKIEKMKVLILFSQVMENTTWKGYRCSSSHLGEKKKQGFWSGLAC